MRILICIIVLLSLVSALVQAEIAPVPDYSMLWNRFTSVRVVDSFTVAISTDGIAVCGYNTLESSFTHINQLFLDDKPIAMRLQNELLIVRTLSDSLLFIDVGHLPELVRLGGVAPESEFSDFFVHEDKLFIGAWFNGIVQYSMTDYGSLQFADSSMKGILVTQLEVRDDTLFALDEYNGIMRYDLSVGGLDGFLDYLYIPFRAATFTLDGSTTIISGLNDGVYQGEFGRPSSGIIDSIPGVSGSQRILRSGNTIVLLSDRQVSLVDRVSFSLLETIPVGDRAVDGDLMEVGDGVWLILPDEAGGLVAYDLENYIGPLSTFDRPGPISGLVLHNNELFTGSESSPIDMFALNTSAMPLWNQTIETERNSVRFMDCNGDSLIVLYSDTQELSVIYRDSVGQEEQWVNISVPAVAENVISMNYVDHIGNSSVDAILITYPYEIHVYTIADNMLMINPVIWTFPGEITSIAVDESRLYVANINSAVLGYQVTEEFELQYMDLIYFSVPIYEMVTLQNRILAFAFNRMYTLNWQISYAPRIASTIILPVTVNEATLDGSTLAVVGDEGVCVLDWSFSIPAIVDWGGRPGDIIAIDGDVLVTSNGESVHIYNLGEGSPTAVTDNDTQPVDFMLSQNYPNPFNPVTAIDFNLPHSASVNLKIFNVLGQCVRTLINSRKSSGRHTVYWDAQDNAGIPVSTGVYFYRLSVGDQVESRKMLLVR